MLEVIAIVFALVALAGGFALTAATGGGEADSSAPPPTLGGRLRLSVSEIAQYARRAGFSGSALATAIAIALAESSGDPVAYNPETAANTPAGKGSYGLWQIYLKAHPEFAGQDLYDPQINANAAYIVYRNAGYTFSPWSTFKNEAYLGHMDEASVYA